MESNQPDGLKGIRLTEEGKKPMQKLLVIGDSEMADVLSDSVRINIMTLLRIGIPDRMTTKTIDEETGDTIIRERNITRHALSVVELMNLSNDSSLDVDPVSMSQIYHHLPKLVESGYIIKYGTVTKGGRTTDYYRRTAEVIIFIPNAETTYADGEQHDQIMRRQYRVYIDKLVELFDIKLAEQEYEKGIDLLIERNDIENQSETIDKIQRMALRDIASPYDLVLFMEMVSLYHMSNPAWLDVSRRLRELFYKGM